MTVEGAQRNSKGKGNSKPDKEATAKKGSTTGDKRKKKPTKGNLTTIRNRTKLQRTRLSCKVIHQNLKRLKSTIHCIMTIFCSKENTSIEYSILLAYK